jgi:hypothetical protein
MKMITKKTKNICAMRRKSNLGLRFDHINQMITLFVSTLSGVYCTIIVYCYQFDVQQSN